MPGPTPKDPSLRRRRNRSATASKLTLAAASRVRAPRLPRRYVLDQGTGRYVVDRSPWHPRTVAWWRDVWASPMAAEFLNADLHGLFLLAELEDRFHRAEKTAAKLELAKEIRLQRQAFGLSPIDRRRLQWEVARGEEADARRRRRSGRSTAPRATDPRRTLAAVE